jgi:hypothetical protein
MMIGKAMGSTAAHELQKCWATETAGPSGLNMEYLLQVRADAWWEVLEVKEADGRLLG